jgi:hypothetical protein
MDDNHSFDTRKLEENKPCTKYKYLNLHALKFK